MANWSVSPFVGASENQRTVQVIHFVDWKSEDDRVGT
jgi:hypothetical protein